MRWAFGTITVLVAAWLQVSWFGHIRPLGVIPNLMLIAVVMFSLWANASSAMAAAIGGGLLVDSASGSDFGIRIAFFVVITLAIVAARQLGLQADSVITAVGIVIVGTVLYNAVILATLSAVPSAAIMHTIGAELLDNSLIALGAWLVKALIEGRRHPAIRAAGELWR